MGARAAGSGSRCARAGDSVDAAAILAASDRIPCLRALEQARRVTVSRPPSVPHRLHRSVRRDAGLDSPRAGRCRADRGRPHDRGRLGRRGRAATGRRSAHAGASAPLRRARSSSRRSGDHTYGVNTGFGRFVSESIPPEQAAELQLRLLRSHACGVGEPYPDEVVRGAMLLRANTLAKGYSGARVETIELLVGVLDGRDRPARPVRGSVGASGDLAPLAHLALPLVGEGEATVGGGASAGAEALARPGSSRSCWPRRRGCRSSTGRSS